MLSISLFLSPSLSPPLSLPPSLSIDISISHLSISSRILLYIFSLLSTAIQHRFLKIVNNAAHLLPLGIYHQGNTITVRSAMVNDNSDRQSMIRTSSIISFSYSLLTSPDSRH